MANPSSMVCATALMGTKPAIASERKRRSLGGVLAHAVPNLEFILIAAPFLYTLTDKFSLYSL